LRAPDDAIIGLERCVSEIGEGVGRLDDFGRTGETRIRVSVIACNRAFGLSEIDVGFDEVTAAAGFGGRFVPAYLECIATLLGCPEAVREHCDALWNDKDFLDSGHGKRGRGIDVLGPGPESRWPRDEAGREVRELHVDCEHRAAVGL